MSNNFPTRPNTTSNPVPTWATAAGAVKADPGDTKRSQGWIFNSSLNSGEIPRLDWVNNESYNTGLWCAYFDQCSTFLKNLIYPSDSSYPASNISYFVVKNYSTVDTSLASGAAITLQSVDVNTDSITAYDFSSGVFTAPATDYYRIDVNLIMELSSMPYSLSAQVFSLSETYPVNTAGNLSANRLYSIYKDYFQTYANEGVGGNGCNISVKAVITRKLNMGDKIQFLAASAKPSSVGQPMTTCRVGAGSTISYSWKF